MTKPNDPGPEDTQAKASAAHDAERDASESDREELSEDELEQTSGGLLPAVELSEPAATLLGKVTPSPNQRWVVGRWTVKTQK